MKLVGLTLEGTYRFFKTYLSAFDFFKKKINKCSLATSDIIFNPNMEEDPTYGKLSSLTNSTDPAFSTLGNSNDMDAEILKNLLTPSLE